MKNQHRKPSPDVLLFSDVFSDQADSLCIMAQAQVCLSLHGSLNLQGQDTSEPTVGDPAVCPCGDKIQEEEGRQSLSVTAQAGFSGRNPKR